tara:strand:- start:549 stop:695 length:147 start_codon:yes stop_codon:yes gene_type:complete
MLNKFNIKLKSIVKLVPDSFSLLNSKIFMYFGLAVVWGIILIGTFFNI